MAMPPGGHNTKLFINYRREDTAPYAGRLYDRLVAHFGEDQVFMDIDQIEPGEDFVEVINRKVGACEIAIISIGPKWLSVTDATGQRRLDDSEDLVRIEILAALERKIRVIPVLVGGARMPRKQDLPEALAPLSRRNAVELSETRFHSDVSRLIDAIEKVRASSEQIVAPSATPAAPVVGRIAVAEREPRDLRDTLDSPVVFDASAAPVAPVTEPEAIRVPESKDLPQSSEIRAVAEPSKPGHISPDSISFYRRALIAAGIAVIIGCIAVIAVMEANGELGSRSPAFLIAVVMGCLVLALSVRSSPINLVLEKMNAKGQDTIEDIKNLPAASPLSAPPASGPLENVTSANLLEGGPIALRHKISFYAAAWIIAFVTSALLFDIPWLFPVGLAGLVVSDFGLGIALGCYSLYLIHGVIYFRARSRRMTLILFAVLLALLECTFAGVILDRPLLLLALGITFVACFACILTVPFGPGWLDRLRRRLRVPSQ